MTMDDLHLRRRVANLCEEGARLLASHAGYEALIAWDIEQHGLWKEVRPLDPALATRLRSLKFRIGKLIAAHYKKPQAARPATCTHRCPVHCPRGRAST